MINRRRLRLMVLVLGAICSVLAASPHPQRARTGFVNSATVPANTSLAETNAERDRRMKWWREARFGMFIHWGLYAVPAGEYKGQRSTRIGEWIMEWANIP